MPYSLTSTCAWSDLVADAAFVRGLETDVLLPYVNTCRWFAGKARPQTALVIGDMHTVPATPTDPEPVARLLILTITYADGGDPEQYLLPLAWLPDGAMTGVPEKGWISPATLANKSGWLVDAIYTKRFRQAIFRQIVEQGTLRQKSGGLRFGRGRGFAASDESITESRVLPVDSSNSALVFGPTGAEVYFLKLYRKLFPQMNPEVEMVAFITQNSDFRNIPAYAGSIIWEPRLAESTPGESTPGVTLGMMQRMVPNKKDNWALTGDYLNQFLYAVPNRMFAISEDVFEQVALLGKRTAEMHCALYQPKLDAADRDYAGFAPEPFTDDYRTFLIQRFTDLLDRRYALLIDNYATLDPLAQRLAWVFMEAKELIEAFVADFRTRPLGSLRVRVHGDYHLGQVLAVANAQQPSGQPAGTDFVIIDFEGEPESTITERKIKHSPLKDVAGMIRSYHYAVSAKLFNADETGKISPEHLQRVADRWFKLIRDTYLDAYLAELGTPHPLFRDNTEINFLLLVYLLEKAVYELGYEISYRPSWVKIPLRGIMDVIHEIEKIHLANPDRTADLPRLQSGLLRQKS